MTTPAPADGSAAQPLRILMVDDQAMVRQGFGALLDAQPDMTVVGSTADGAEMVDLVRTTRPDVVLMDIRMPRVNGLDATRAVFAMPGDHHPRVIMLTTFDADEYVFAALQAGASGFLLKDSTAEDLVAAVRVVAAGDALLSPSVTRTLITDYVSRILAKLGLRDRTQMVVTAYESGLVSRGG